MRPSQTRFKPSKDRYKLTTFRKQFLQCESFKPSKDRYKQVTFLSNRAKTICFKPSKDRYKRISKPSSAKEVDMFQTLKGSLQTLRLSGRRAIRDQFQTLKGSLQTLGSGLQKTGSEIGFKPSKDRYKPQRSHGMRSNVWRVSNPQRIATNLLIPLLAFSTYMFQTLKGLLQTHNSGNNVLPQKEFQTLKGSLQTLFLALEKAEREIVSNPQRIATNSSASLPVYASLERFKPSKDRYKP